MFTFAKIAGAHAKVFGKAENGKTIIIVTVPNVSTGKEAKAALAKAGYAEGEAAKHNWAWGGQEYLAFKRHVADEKKAKAIVKAINDAHKPEPKKASTKKAEPKKSTPKAKTPEQELKELFELSARINARIAEIIG